MEFRERLRQVRADKNMTLDQIADKSGLSKATLSRLENGLTSGTFSTHMKICEAMGISINEFYRGLEPKGEDVVAVETRLKDVEAFSYDERASSIILAKRVSSKNMLPQLMVIQPGGKTSQEENPVGTEKFIFCLDGNIEAIVDNKAYAMQKGSSLYFKASLPHYFKNIGKATAKFICVSSPIVL